MYPNNQSHLSSALPGAILPSRLDWLCQPTQIEHTLLLLFFLNSWKRASSLLLYADRQGLQEIQLLIIGHASQMGSVQAVAYFDRSGQFPGELLRESAADNAARGLLIHLKSLCDPDIWPSFLPDGDRIYQRYIRPLYRRITGNDFPRVSDAVDALEPAPLRDFLQDRLQRLVAQAKRTREPIPHGALSRLCIAPIDLLPIRENRVYFLDGYDTWSDLDVSDQRKLDPEGLSEIAFASRSSSAEFVFHLPFRQAALFIPPERLHELQCEPDASQERGIYQGRPIDEAEGLKHPARGILQDLGVDLASVCPHGLVDKQSYLAQPAIRELLWPVADQDQDAWLDDVWNGLCLPPSDR